MKNQLIAKYNNPNTLLVFSSYALKDEDLKNQNALSWYTKELISLFPKKQKIVVLSEINHEDRIKITKKDNILIIACWKKSDLKSVFNLFSYFFKFNKTKNVLFEFEFNIFGHLFGPLFTLIYLLYLKLIGKKIIFQLHEVVLDLHKIKKQIHLDSDFLLSFFNLALIIFYKSIGFLADKIIVTENSLKKKLEKIIASKKIAILPIPTFKKKLISPEKAQKKLGVNFKNKLVMLFFGYLSWYKGIDKLVKIFPKLKKQIPNLVLIIAGDKSPTLSKNKQYEMYYIKLKKMIKKNKDIIHTGFIDEKQIKLWINASDLMILPYRIFKSSSGPLSWALSYKKPILFSNALKEYIISPDFKKAMLKNKIKLEELFFKLESKSLISLLKKTSLKKLSNFSKTLRDYRLNKKISKKLNSLFKVKHKENVVLNILPYFEFLKRLKLSYGK